MELSLEGKTALVTGASRGIGLAIAHRFAEAGANVMLSSRKADVLEAAVAGLSSLSGSAAWSVAHAADPEQAEACVAHTIEHFGALDILVNNAGTNPHFGPMMEINQVQMEKTNALNQQGVVLWSQSAYRQSFATNGGNIINVASIGGLGVEPGIGWYNVTKAAVIHITHQLSYELAPKVRVNALAPGLVKTDFARVLWEKNEEEIVRHIPLKRLGVPDDIAKAALFLASDASSWITGQVLVIDGGTTHQPTGGVG